MRRSLLLGLAGVALLLLPAPARAQQWSFRLALETPLYAHATVDGQSSATGINDSFRPTIDVLGSYFFSDWSVDLEFRRGLAATGTGQQQVPAFLGPGTTFDVNGFPLYARASVLFQIENAFTGSLRVGGGLKILDLAFVRVYAEITGDFGLWGSGLSFFGSQSVSAGLGVWLKV